MARGGGVSGTNGMSGGGGEGGRGAGRVKKYGHAVSIFRGCIKDGS